jgi:hypothetical protein
MHDWVRYLFGRSAQFGQGMKTAMKGCGEGTVTRKVYGDCGLETNRDAWAKESKDGGRHERKMCLANVSFARGLGLCKARVVRRLIAMKADLSRVHY